MSNDGKSGPPIYVRAVLFGFLQSMIPMVESSAVVRAAR
jgi:hypothetical protein